MKIGIVSDTHDHKEKILKIFKSFEEEGIKEVVHLGDLISPFNFGFIRSVYSGNLYVVFGNNDGEKLYLVEQARVHNIQIFPRPRELTIGSVKLVVMHEPFMVKELAETQKFHIVAYGHTHRIHLEKVGSTFIINPGEACGYLTGKATFAIFDGDKFDCDIREV